MTDLRVAAQQALEALEGWENHDRWVWPESALEQAKRNTTEALAALRAALAEPVQEPVQEPQGCDHCNHPLYAAVKCRVCGRVTEPVEPVEPVAWMVYTEGGTSAYVTDNPNDLVGAYRALALYTSPPQRKPLSEDEKRALADKFLSCQPQSYEVSGVFDLISAVERAHGIGGEG